MATKCPWFNHNCAPDPAALGARKGQQGVCNRCWLRYRVDSTSPYKLSRATAGSIPTIRGIAEHAAPESAKKYAALLEDPEVKRTIARRNPGR